MTTDAAAANGHAVVTGGASGIGLAVVRRLLDRGAAVTVLDVDGAAVDRLRRDPAAGGGRLRAVVVDVADHDATGQAVADAASAAGRPDRLVTCAGIRGSLVPALDTDLAEWRRLMDVHLFGTWAACHAFAAQLLDGVPAGETVDAAVVTVSSMVSFGGAFATQLGYGTAKAAVAYLTKVLAVEWAARGIRVNAVAPGFTATPMVEDMIAHGYDLGPAEARTPMGRLGRPEETARAIEFLLYDAAYVTGTVLPVDGGWTAAGR
ncbi:MAG TPA: SDR family NAD(P)-dependent oxidoreductase [Acidimicrobiales bacterium]|nr:SDR family NAD(P)-dependent oxidoreductase [Acidimicrobiales bacterium]